MYTNELSFISAVAALRGGWEATRVTPPKIRARKSTLLAGCYLDLLSRCRLSKWTGRPTRKHSLIYPLTICRCPISYIIQLWSSSPFLTVFLYKTCALLIVVDLPSAHHALLLRWVRSPSFEQQVHGSHFNHRSAIDYRASDCSAIVTRYQRDRFWNKYLTYRNYSSHNWPRDHSLCFANPDIYSIRIVIKTLQWHQTTHPLWKKNEANMFISARNIMSYPLTQRKSIFYQPYHVHTTDKIDVHSSVTAAKLAWVLVIYMTKLTYHLKHRTEKK